MSGLPLALPVYVARGAVGRTNFAFYRQSGTRTQTGHHGAHTARRCVAEVVEPWRSFSATSIPKSFAEGNSIVECDLSLYLTSVSVTPE